MLIQQILFGLFALSIPVVGLVVVARLVWSAYRALRASRITLAALSVLAVACLLALFAVVAAVWFGYAVAHSKKDLWSDLGVALLTGLPFYVGSYAFWRMARHFQSVLAGHAAPSCAAAPAQSTRTRP